MKQTRTTLRKFIKDFPVKSMTTETQPFPDLSALSYKEAYKLSTEGFRSFRILSVKEESIYCALKVVSVARSGRKFYKKSEIREYLYIGPSEVNIKRSSYDEIEFLLQLAQIDWFKDIPQHVTHRYFLSSSILKSILVRTIYNEETFYKAIAKRIYHIDISWRAMKKFCESEYLHINLVDVFAFCVRPERGLMRFMEAPFELRQEMIDMLTMAVQLNQMIDFCWSEARIHEEHQKQIEIKQAAEIARKSRTPIYNGFDTPDNIKLLNTELDVFMEGTRMHHCLYSCYWNRIKSHKFIAFHMTVPEDCTFSVILCNDKHPILEQCHLKHNRSVSKETRDQILKFIEDNSSQLKEMFNQKVEEDSFDLFAPIHVDLDNDLDFNLIF